MRKKFRVTSNSFPHPSPREGVLVNKKGLIKLHRDR